MRPEGLYHEGAAAHLAGVVNVLLVVLLAQHLLNASLQHLQQLTIIGNIVTTEICPMQSIFQHIF